MAKRSERERHPRSFRSPNKTTLNGEREKKWARVPTWRSALALISLTAHRHMTPCYLVSGLSARLGQLEWTLHCVGNIWRRSSHKQSNEPGGSRRPELIQMQWLEDAINIRYSAQLPLAEYWGACQPWRLRGIPWRQPLSCSFVPLLPWLWLRWQRPEPRRSNGSTRPQPRPPKRHAADELRPVSPACNQQQ